MNRFLHSADDTLFPLTAPLLCRSVLDSVQTDAPSSPGHPEDRPGKRYQCGHHHLPAVPRQTPTGGESVYVHHGHQQQPLGWGALLPTYVDTPERHAEEMKLRVGLVLLQRGEIMQSLCIPFFAVKWADSIMPVEEIWCLQKTTFPLACSLLSLFWREGICTRHYLADILQNILLREHFKLSLRPNGVKDAFLRVFVRYSY